MIELHAWPELGSNQEPSEKVLAPAAEKEEKRRQAPKTDDVRKERSKSDPQQRFNHHRNNRGKGKHQNRNGRYHSYSSGYQQQYRNKYHYRYHELPDMNAYKFWIKGQM